MIQDGNQCLVGAIFANGEVDDGGLRARILGRDLDQPALLCQPFCHPGIMPLRAGQSISNSPPLRSQTPAWTGRQIQSLSLPGSPGVMANRCKTPPAASLPSSVTPSFAS